MRGVPGTIGHYETELRLTRPTGQVDTLRACDIRPGTVITDPDLGEDIYIASTQAFGESVYLYGRPADEGRDEEWGRLFDADDIFAVVELPTW